MGVEDKHEEERGQHAGQEETERETIRDLVWREEHPIVGSEMACVC